MPACRLSERNAPAARLPGSMAGAWRRARHAAASPLARSQEALLSKAEGALARSLRRANALKPAPAIAKHGARGPALQSMARDEGRQQGGESDADEEEGRGRALGAAPRKAVMTRAELFTSAKAAKRQRQKQRSAS